MDRRSFLKMLAVVPFTKEIAKSFIEPSTPEPVEELVIDWRDSIVDDETSFAYYNDGTPDVIYRNLEYDAQIFAPDPDNVGGFIAVGRLSDCDCYPGLDVQIRIGHSDTQNILDLQK